MCRNNHNIAVDELAMGVMTYELMMGKRPYQNSSRRDMKNEILTKQIIIKKSDIPPGWSCEAADFINKVLN